MKIKQFQVDAFARKVFEGNPAAVCPLQAWLPDATMQAIAAENNLSETAFFVPGAGGFELRWFTRVAEVDLCGHATLASAHVLFSELGYDGTEIRFATRSGELRVRRADSGLLAMDFPAIDSQPCASPRELIAGLGAEPNEVYAADDYLAVFSDAHTVRQLSPDFATLSKLALRGVIATAPSGEVDFVSRCFAPKYGIPEDPVTGSAHCALAPYWAKRLGKQVLRARQISKRGGELYCELVGNRVVISGTAVTFLGGELRLGSA